RVRRAGRRDQAARARAAFRVRVPAGDRVRRRSAEDADGQDPAGGAAGGGAEAEAVGDAGLAADHVGSVALVLLPASLVLADCVLPLGRGHRWAGHPAQTAEEDAAFAPSLRPFFIAHRSIVSLSRVASCNGLGTRKESTAMREVVTGEGYAVGTLDDLGDAPGFRKIRTAFGVTAFGINAVVIPPGIESGRHFHDEQEELYFVHQGELEFVFGEGGEERHRLGPGGIA